MKNKLLFIGLLIFVILLFNIPSYGYFEISDFTIDANLLPDGSMDVTEKIVYDTDISVNLVSRDIETVNKYNHINSASNVEINDVKLDGLSFKETYRRVSFYYGEDNSTRITITEDDDNIKARVFQYEYTLENVAVVYNDTAELFWSFIDSEFESHIKNLTINITLPTIAGNDNILVYGHGSTDGKFTKNSNHVTLNVKDVPAYNPIMTKILFSKDAVSDSTKLVNGNVLDMYKNQEEGMPKEPEERAILFGLSVNKLAVIVGGIIMIIAIGIYIVFDKEERVKKPKYYREMPFDLAPEVLQYIYYRKPVSNSYYIGVLNLIKLGVYELENTVNQVGKETQLLIYNENHTAELKDYQKEMVKRINGFLKDDNKGRKSIDMLRLKSKMERSSSSGYLNYIASLQAEKEELLGKPSRVPIKVILITIFTMLALIAFICFLAILLGNTSEVFGLAMFLLLTSLVYSVFFATVGNFLPVLIFLLFHAGCFQVGIIMMMKECGVLPLYPTYLMVFALIQYVIRVKKYSKEERQIVEYIKGLKRYIKDYSMLEEKVRVRENLALWEDYFIMSIALGLNTKTIDYFYDYGKVQASNLGYSMSNTSSYISFHNPMYSACYSYQKIYTKSNTPRKLKVE